MPKLSEVLLHWGIISPACPWSFPKSRYISLNISRTALLEIPRRHSNQMFGPLQLVPLNPEEHIHGDAVPIHLSGCCQTLSPILQQDPDIFELLSSNNSFPTQNEQTALLQLRSVTLDLKVLNIWRYPWSGNTVMTKPLAKVCPYCQVQVFGCSFCHFIFLLHYIGSWFMKCQWKLSRP